MDIHAWLAIHEIQTFYQHWSDLDIHWHPRISMVLPSCHGIRFLGMKITCVLWGAWSGGWKSSHHTSPLHHSIGSFFPPPQPIRLILTPPSTHTLDYAQISIDFPIMRSFILRLVIWKSKKNWLNRSFSFFGGRLFRFNDCSVVVFVSVGETRSRFWEENCRKQLRKPLGELFKMFMDSP